MSYSTGYMRFVIKKISTLLFHYFRIDGHYFFSGTVWLTVIQAITVLGALIVTVVLANALDESEYGVYRYILGIGALLSSFSLTGVGQSVFQTAAQGHKWFYPLGIKKSLMYSLGITLSSLIGSIYYFLQNNIELALGCLLIAIFQPLLNTFQQIFPFLQGERRFRESTILQGIKTLIITIATVGTVYVTQDIFWLVFAYLLSNTATNLATHFLYRPKAVSNVDKAVLTRFMNYAKNTSIRNIISIIAFRIDSVIVFQQLGATQLAIYTIANILPDHIKASFKNIITLLVPKYALHDNMDSIKKSMLKRSLQLLIITVVVMILYIIIAPLIYTLLFPKYHQAILFSQIIVLSFPAMIALIPLSALQAHTKQKELNTLNIQISVVMIITTGLLTTTHGLIGAVLAKILSRYIGLFLAYYHFLKS